MTVYLQ